MKAAQALCTAYRQQLASAHDENCPYRFEAQQYLRHSSTLTNGVDENHNDNKSEMPLIPTAFAPMIQCEYLRLLEHPSPSRLFMNRVMSMSQKIFNSKQIFEPTFTLPKMHMAKELQIVKKLGVETNDEPTSGVLTILRPLLDQIRDKNRESLVLLTLLGWNPIPQESGSPNDKVSVGCPLCLSVLDIPLMVNTLTTEKPLQKRQKKESITDDPYNAHRYYCPIVCGFPTSLSLAKGCEPLWRALLHRVHEDYKPGKTTCSHEQLTDETLHDDQETGEDLRRARTILHSGIIPRPSHHRVKDCDVVK